MATENELQDNIGDANQIHTNEALGSGKIKVALVDPMNGTLERKVKIDWNTEPSSSDEKTTDKMGEVVFDIPNNATRAEIMVESAGRVRALSFVVPHSITIIVLK